MRKVVFWSLGLLAVDKKDKIWTDNNIKRVVITFQRNEISDLAIWIEDQR